MTKNMQIHKARYTEVPEPVTFHPAGNGYTTVIIALNAEAAKELAPDGSEMAFYWVDYNEFIIADNALNRDAVLADPAAWLNCPGDDPKLQAEVIEAVQARMDAVAQSHGYDNIFTACTYAGDTHPIYGPEGDAAKAWRSACWAFCLQLLADIRAGKVSKPACAEDVVEQLPPHNWPQLRN